MQEKICKKCGIIKELNENNFCIGIYSNGNQYFKTPCRLCRQEYAKYNQMKKGSLIKNGEISIIKIKNNKCKKTRYNKNITVINNKNFRKCSYCKESKEESINNFRIRKNRNNMIYNSICIICEKECNYQYDHNKRDKNKANERRRIKNTEHRKLNPLPQKLTEEEKSIRDIENRKIYKKRRKQNPVLKMKDIVSNSVRGAMKRQNSRKNRQSVLKFLPYTMDELKKYIELLFEDWMTWKNHGPYISSEWDDNDKSTWKWNLDHIEPHADFEYTSMDCEEFRKCWSLSNLRPLSAKQNVIDGVNRVRNKKKKRKSKTIK